MHQIVKIQCCHGYRVGSFLQSCYGRHIIKQIVKPHHMRQCLFHKIAHSFGRHLLVFVYRVKIAFDNAYRSFQFVIDIVCQLTFELAFLFESAHGFFMLMFSSLDSSIFVAIEFHYLSTYITQLIGVKFLDSKFLALVVVLTIGKVTHQFYISTEIASRIKSDNDYNN